MSTSPFRLAVRLAAALALAAAVAVRAEDQPRSLSDTTSQALQKLKPLEEAKNFAGILALLDGLPNINPNSYDMALIQSAKANTYIRMEQYSKAIEPMEKALTLGDAYKYFDDRQKLDLVYYLAQLYLQEGANTKDPARQDAAFGKAIGYFKRWLGETKKPTPEVLVNYASALYYRAAANPNKVDQKLLDEARVQVEKGLLSAVHPKDSFYSLLLSIYQQQNDIIHSAELIELLLKQSPTKAQFWPVLMASYLNISNELEKKDPAEAKSYLVRAIVTMERAQALGFMKTPKDNMNLVSLYLTAGQGNVATDFLYDGLKSGKIESEPKAWMNLGLIYQQNNKELQAISVLQEAAKIYPTNGQFNYLIGEIYRALEKNRDAYEQYKEAIRKGSLEKPYVVYQLLAYAAFELEEFDEALKTVEKAATFPEAKKDVQLPRLRDAIEGAIKEREYLKAEAAKKAKSNV